MSLADYSLSIISDAKWPFIDLIRSGEKKAEGRVYSQTIRRFQVGKTLCLYSRDQRLVCQITDLHVYPSFEKMIQGEGFRNMIPFANTEQEALRIYQSFPGAMRVKVFGAVAICLRPIE